MTDSQCCLLWSLGMVFNPPSWQIWFSSSCYNLDMKSQCVLPMCMRCLAPPSFIFQNDLVSIGPWYWQNSQSNSIWFNSIQFNPKVFICQRLVNERKYNLKTVNSRLGWRLCKKFIWVKVPVIRTHGVILNWVSLVGRNLQYCTMHGLSESLVSMVIEKERCQMVHSILPY